MAFILGVLTFVVFILEYGFGRTFLKQPIIICFLTGLIMGDPTTGIIIGGTLELAFLGAISIGATGPPDTLTGGVLATAFVIRSGADTVAALAFAFPIATIAIMLETLYEGYVVSLFNRYAEKCADAADYKGIERAHILAGTGKGVIKFLIVTVFFGLGSDLVTNILNAIPEFVTSGLNIVVGLLPAIGFSLLAKTLVKKSNMHIFLCGFAFVAYLNMPILGVALFGLILALIMVQSGPNTAETGGNEDEF